MNVAAHASYLQNLSSRAGEHRTFSWSDGRFDVARRGYTEFVEGAIRSSSHLIMATLEGGAARHRYVTDCGYSYDGIDAAGCASLLPAHTERRLRLEAVSWRWASIAISPDRFRELTDGATIRAFSTREDPFLVSLLGQLAWHQEQDGKLDITYVDAISLALVQHLRLRYGNENAPIVSLPGKLPSWGIRRIREYVEAQLPGEIRVAVLADILGLSEGHFHRAFRATIGRTPLQFINELRVQKAIQIMGERPTSVTELALSVGFSSPTHFARVFHKVVGCFPSEYRPH
jgi:AraC family transcriptional regulator